MKVCGVKGASVLLRIGHFNVVKGVSIDWMHCVLLGIVKQFLDYWLTMSNRGSAYFIGDKVLSNAVSFAMLGLHSSSVHILGQ